MPTPKFRGVVWATRKSQWRATLNLGAGRLKELGHYADEEEAARAYDEAAKLIYASPVLNFQPDGSLNPDRKKRVSQWACRVLLDGDGGGSQGDEGGEGDDRASTGGKGGGGGSDSEYEPDGDGSDSSMYISDDSEEEEEEEEEEAARNQKQRRNRNSSSEKYHSTHHSTFRGVIRVDSKWHARIFFQNRTTHLGSFATEEEAARAYDAEARRVWINPFTNFLPNGVRAPNRKSRRGRTLVARPGAKPRDGGGTRKDKKEPREKRVSSFRGVVWDRSKWRAQIKFKNQIQNLGRFATDEEAARAHDAAAKSCFTNATLNWLPDGSLNPNRREVRKYGSLKIRPGAKPPSSSSSSMAASLEDHRLLALVDEGMREAEQLEQLEQEEQEEKKLPPTPPPPPPIMVDMPLSPSPPPPPPPLVIEGPMYEV